MVKRDTANKESTSTLKKYPSHANTPQTISMSCKRANSAKNEYHRSYLKLIYKAIPRKAKRREIKLLLSSCFPRLGPIISTEVFALLNGPKDLLTSATTESD